LTYAEQLERQGDYEGALVPLAEAAAFARKQEPPDLALVLRALSKRASVLVALTRYADARAVVAEALPLLKAGGAEADARMVELQQTLGDSYRYEEQLEPALASFQVAAGAAERHSKARRAQLITVLQRIVDTQALLRRDQAAAATVERLRTVVESGSANDSVREKLGLAAAYKRVGRVDRAQQIGVQLSAFARRWSRETGAIIDVDFVEALAPNVPFPEPGKPKRVAPIKKEGNVPDAAKKVAALRPGFRACYQRLLQTDKTAQGSVILSIDEGSTGAVTKILGMSTGLPRLAVDCVLEHAATAVFSEPSGGSAKISVPVTFVKK
jgi:hypothetical protein